MDQLAKENLFARNNKIIEIIMKQINEECPDSIDMIAIGGSFCNGDIYEKSDLDLVIISRDEKAKCLDKCFILGDVAMDVYTHDWTSFEGMANYPNPYVTKLLDLDIIYVHDEDVLKKYKELQVKLKENMHNPDLVLKRIQEHFNIFNVEFEKIKQNESDLGQAYRSLAKLIGESEFIIYMTNNSYVKRGTKRVLEEVCSMEILPKGFVEIYQDITNCSSIEEVKEKARALAECITAFVEKKGIKSVKISNEENTSQPKKEIMPNNLFGSYEEIYSNWKNKMQHAVDINSRYLSFVTMNSCQGFYDEMFESFDIPHIELLTSFNPNDLSSNVNQFNNCMAMWLNLYKQNGVEVNYYANLTELENLYKQSQSEKTNIKI